MAQHKFKLKFRSTLWLREMVALVQANSMNEFIQRHLTSHWYTLPPEVLAKSSVKSLHPSRLNEIQRGSHFASYAVLHALNSLRREHHLTPWTEDEIQTAMREDAETYACALDAERASRTVSSGRRRQGVLTDVVMPTVGSWWITRYADRPNRPRQIAEIRGDAQSGTWACRFHVNPGERSLWVKYGTLRNAYHPTAAPAVAQTNGAARAALPPLPGAPTVIPPTAPAIPQMVMLTSDQMRLVIAQELYAVFYTVTQSLAQRIGYMQQPTQTSPSLPQAKA